MNRPTPACPPQALIDAYKESHDARVASDAAERRLLKAARRWMALWRTSLTSTEEGGVGAAFLAAFDADVTARERMARARQAAGRERRRAYGPLAGKAAGTRGARGSARRGRPGNRTGRTRPHRE